MDLSQVGLKLAQGLIPVVVMVLIALLAMMFAYLRKKLVWLDQTRVDEQVEQMAKNVVVSLQEDLVDGLKAASEDGKLTSEEVAMIKQQALSNLMQLLTEEQRDILATLTGDISTWLATTIQRVLVEFKQETGNVGVQVGELMIGSLAENPLAESPQE